MAVLLACYAAAMERVDDNYRNRVFLIFLSVQIIMIIVASLQDKHQSY